MFIAKPKLPKKWSPKKFFGLQLVLDFGFSAQTHPIAEPPRGVRTGVIIRVRRNGTCYAVIYNTHFFHPSASFASKITDDNLSL